MGNKKSMKKKYNFDKAFMVHFVLLPEAGRYLK